MLILRIIGFRLASVSKIVGATMLAHLVQTKRLDPDAPIGRYLTELPKAYQTITARQLMSHTSGLPHYQPIDAMIGSRHYSSALSALGTLKDRDLLSKPGTMYQYTSHGFTLVGALYEKITGESLNESIPKFISGLTGRASPVIEDITRRNRARSNLFERDGMKVKTSKFDDKSYSIFGAGLTATASDLALFGDAVLHSSQLTAKTKKLLFEPISTSLEVKTGRSHYQVGFGWRIGEDDKIGTIYHHAGVTPGARSVIVLSPEKGISIAFLSNIAWTAQIEKTAIALARLTISSIEGDLEDLNSEVIEPFENNFYGEFDGQSINGLLKCEYAGCYFSDNNGALSQWLNRFNSTGEPIKRWPAHLYETNGKTTMLLVTKVGFVFLDSGQKDRVLSATIASNKGLSVKFEKAVSY